MSPRQNLLTLGVLLFLAVVPDLRATGGDTPAESLATTAVGGGTFDLNTFLGADRYYTNSTPITGQNTVTVNLEGGHIWSGHEALQHVTTFYNSAGTWGGGSVAPLYDRHATWAGLFIGGREMTNGGSIKQVGIAPGTDLRSAAVATSWNGSAYALEFNFSANSYITAYANAFAVGDVINSSYGRRFDPGGVDVYTVFTDAMSFQNSDTLHVISAGNFGSSGANTVTTPGSGYNAMTVAALGSANTFDSAASFSSRAPQNFSYYDYAAGGAVVTVTNVRAAVDMAAPGESLTSAFYGGQTGGNNTSLPGSVDGGSDPDAYDTVSGTSFSAPIVAGGAALLYSAAKTLPQLATNAEAVQNMVAKSLLLTAADKTSGWSNDQFATNGVVTTTQSLDWAVGAGRMNLDRTFDLQVNGQRGVGGQSTGAQGAVLGAGWDFGASQNGINNDYTISDVLLGGSTFTTSLSWLRVRTYAGGLVNDYAQANLNLSLWSLGSDNSFQAKVAESISLYNTVEHLSFALPSTGIYGLRVSYAGNTFDNTGGLWGNATYKQGYGLAWDGDIVTAVYLNPSGTNPAIWDGSAAVFNTSPGGGGSSTAATTTNTQVVFEGGTNPSSAVTVSGSRAAGRLIIENGAFTFDGTNNAAIILGGGGITNKSTVIGTTTFGASVGLNLGASQSWNNAASNALVVQGSAGGTGDLALRANSAGGIVLSGLVNQSGALSNSGTGAGTTTISGVIGTNVTGVTQDSATSKLILAGSNSYTGNTTVAEGELVVSGSIASSALTSVQSGGILSGTGTLGDTIILNGGTGNPGNSPGTQNIAGDLTWLGGGNYNWQIHDGMGTAGQPTGWDLYDVSGILDLSALTVGSKFNINLWSLSGVAPDVNGNAFNFNAGQNYTWIIVATDLGIVGFDPAEFNINVVANNGTSGFSNALLGGAFGVRVSGNDLQLTFTAAVPEPGTWATAAILLLFAGALRRWSRNRSDRGAQS
jgi:autotransporter-associated beta strand protein